MPNHSKHLARTLRRQRLLTSIKSGMTVEAAAAEEGINKATAGAMIGAALKELAAQNTELAEHVRDLELARLDTLMEQLWPLAQRRDPYVICQSCGEQAGSAVEMKHLVGCEEPSYQYVQAKVNLQAHDRLLKILERRAKLLGLDSPTKIQVTGEVAHHHELVDDSERERLEAAWRRRQDSITAEPVQIEP